jgi:hypothetical protein
MTPKQLDQLRSLEERLVDALLEECDPDQWEGAGERIGQMDKETRNARAAARASASAMVSLVNRIQVVIERGILSPASVGYREKQQLKYDKFEEQGRLLTKRLEGLKVVSTQ